MIADYNHDLVILRNTGLVTATDTEPRRRAHTLPPPTPTPTASPTADPEPRRPDAGASPPSVPQLARRVA